MSTPQIPPRPARSQQSEATATSAQTPVVPPRPSSRRPDRPESPHFPRSPLNEIPYHPHHGEGTSDLHRIASLNASRSSIDLPARPPSVSLPSIGQEGSEYEASTPQPQEEATGILNGSPATSPTHTREVGHDLPLHAPRPSLSSSDAKQRVAAVVRTDSNTSVAVAAAGEKSVNSADKTLRSKPSFNRPPSSSSDRPGSAYEDEHGIPNFGQQVPLAAQYGDVQAPSPAPDWVGPQPQAPGSPAIDRPVSSRNHNRSRSGRHNFQAPPGSYGLHGHGVYENVDDFEKEWLRKHPDVLREEIAAHSPAILDRHEYNMTPEQLNSIVRGSKSGGFATAGPVTLPDEQIGYLASDAYTSRNATPRPTTSDSIRQIAAEVHQESPLRQSAIHVNEPDYKENKHMGRGQASQEEHRDLGPASTEAPGGWIEESGYGVPILASDEIDPANEHLHPAIPPMADARRGSYTEDTSRPNSRPSSRPSSIHNVPALNKTISRTERDHHFLEDVQEYEPLFPEDPKDGKPATAADRFKARPDLRQRFPSQDIWEDAPDSVNLSTEVETPEPERHSVFETPDQEAARKGETTEADKKTLLPKEERLAKSAFKPHIIQEMRPSLSKQRFPSQDIWEDSPESTYITTVVGDSGDESKEVEDEGLEAGAVVQTSTSLPRAGATAGAPAAEVTAAARPAIPPRPVRGKSPEKDEKTLPTVPARPARRPSPNVDEINTGSQDSIDRTKPIIPARPAKSSIAYQNSATGDDTLERKLSNEIAAKPKPPVPARPVGGKIAALQAGFMSDLNKKLGLGPQAVQPKADSASEPPVAESKPLEDARKSRARGPARRKPAASPSSAAAATASGKSVSPEQAPRKFVVSPVISLLEISPEGALKSTHADGCSAKLAASSEPRPDTLSGAETVTTDSALARTISQTEGIRSAQPEDESGTNPSEVRQTASVALGSKNLDIEQEHVSEQSLVKDVESESRQEENATLSKSISGGTQTGEMNIIMDKDGPHPTQLTGYKNGSVHSEGIAFTEDAAKKDEDTSK